MSAGRGWTLGKQVAVLLVSAAAATCAVAHPHDFDADETGLAETFVRHALSMRGHPYRYGGERPGGFDCSGLVNYAARRVGVHLPRTSGELAVTGRKVSRSSLRPGDLVFFHQSGRKRLHVGIYVGDDYFVHAPSTGSVVRVDDLQARYYRHHFWQARRMRFENEWDSESMRFGQR